jgi:PAS domain S-box-containing protein
VIGRSSSPRDLASSLLTAIVESSDDAIASKNLDGVVTSWNRAAERLFGYAAAEMIGQPIARLAAPGREGEMPAILERIRQGERVDHFDTVRRRKDGTLVEVSLTVSPVRDDAGRIVGASKIARDITERRRAERERELRFGELRHRVKNLLAMVQALARRTEAAGRSGEQYRAAFLGRLEALTVAHELAFGAEGSADLATVVARTLEPYAGERAAVTVAAGPAVMLPLATVQALALVLHELATNAVKHGAWSTPEGRVRVGWRVEDGVRLRLYWEERGGPRVGPFPARGFGTTLIAHVAAGELGGPAELTFAPKGLHAEVTVLLG